MDHIYFPCIVQQIAKGKIISLPLVFYFVTFFKTKKKTDNYHKIYEN